MLLQTGKTALVMFESKVNQSKWNWAPEGFVPHLARVIAVPTTPSAFKKSANSKHDVSYQNIGPRGNNKVRRQCTKGETTRLKIDIHTCQGANPSWSILVMTWPWATVPWSGDACSNQKILPFCPRIDLRSAKIVHFFFEKTWKNAKIIFCWGVWMGSSHLWDLCVWATGEPRVVARFTSPPAIVGLRRWPR